MALTQAKIEVLKILMEKGEHTNTELAKVRGGLAPATTHIQIQSLLESGHVTRGVVGRGDIVYRITQKGRDDLRRGK